MPLGYAIAGEENVIKRIGGSPDVKQHLEDMGFVVGAAVKMLVEDYDRKNGYLTGHTEGKIVIRFASRDKNLIGQIVNVRVTSASPLSIEGELVE